MAATATATAPPLLGPPEIRRPHAPAHAEEPSPMASDPFVDLLTANFNSAGVARQPMGLTENLSPTFLYSGDPCLDFFFQVVPDTPPETLTELLGSAWRQNPLTALKLVCHLRGVRGTGKSDREGFYAAALWLHRYHSKTLALNARTFAEFGYLKDLPEILHRLLYGADVRKVAKEERMRKRGGGRGRFHGRRGGWNGAKRSKNAPAKEQPREERIAAEREKVKVRMDEASVLRKKKRAEMATRAVERYARDPDYRDLHDRVSDLFAQLLLADLEHLKSGHLRMISLGAKWCPSLDSSFDLSTLICESIARRVFPRESHPEYREIEEEHYAYRVRDRLRKEVLVPLRGALELPEVYMSAQQWNVLPYNRVASVAMKTYKKLFLKHDAERFGEFLSKVREGKSKIAAGALLPHQVLAEAARGEQDEVAELQWRRMVKDLSDKGKLRNCIAVCDVSGSMHGTRVAVCDVSGSMHGTPMDVCVALGLLVSELSEEPWKGKVITFSHEPELHRIEGETIKDKMEFVTQMKWGMNTDFQKVFDQILRVAVEGKLPADKMIKRVFVFSDMEFDQASANSWETDYEAICRKFRENGYEYSVPEIVFWNLRSSRSVPVVAGQKGVALVSGFSKNMLTMFLEGDWVVSPQKVMEAAISGKEYQKLVVFD